MFFKVLKKDLLKKIALNIIMLIFIVIATTFFAGSVNCLLASTNSLDNFMEISNAPDLGYIVYYTPESEEQLKKVAENDVFKDPEIGQSYLLTPQDITYLNSETNAVEEVSGVPTVAICRDDSKYGIMFDENDKRISLKKGEIALPVTYKSHNNINLGDKITIDTGNGKFEYIVSAFTKDALFGSEFISMKRVALCQEDYEKIGEKCHSAMSCIYFFSDTDDLDEAQNILREQKLSIIFDGTKELFKWTYILNLIISMVFIIVSICLMLISACVLRFTIVFTLRGDFKEIGVMKAIGVKNKFIRTLYSSKYIFLAILGASIGFVFSFPFEKILSREMSKSFVLGSYNLFFINIICAALIVCFVTAFCYLSTGKLKKFSAIDAIRNGESGERFKKKSFLRLEKRKKMKPFVFLAKNDVLSNPKQFFIMIMTFSLGILLIMPIVNSVNTLRDDSIIKMFAMTESEYMYSDTEGIVSFIVDSTEKVDIHDHLDEIEQKLAENGIDAHLGVEISLNPTVMTEGSNELNQIFAMQGIGTDINDYEFMEGTPPKLKNEIAISQISADELGVKIGDTINVTFGEITQEYIITATYQSLNNLGKGLRFSPTAELDYKLSAGSFAMQIFLNEPNTDELERKLKDVLSEEKILTCSEFIDSNIGSISDQLDSVTKLVLVLVICINSLITFLMMKSFIIREKREIAMLKSIGFKNNVIMSWHVARIVIVIIISIVIAAILSIPLNEYVVQLPFKMMGSVDMDIVVKPLEVFVFYPMIIFIFTFIAAVLSVIGISRVSVRNINNVE